MLRILLQSYIHKKENVKFLEISAVSFFLTFVRNPAETRNAAMRRKGSMNFMFPRNKSSTKAG